MTPFNLIKAQMGKMVPFATHAGVLVDSIGPGTGTASLQHEKQTSNHIGTMHAGALFTLGETASGAAMLGAFAPRVLEIEPVAASANIQYVRIAKGPIRAEATVGTAVETLMEDLNANGKTQFDATIRMLDQKERVVALMTVEWSVRLKKP